MCGKNAGLRSGVEAKALEIRFELPSVGLSERIRDVEFSESRENLVEIAAGFRRMQCGKP